MADIILSWLEVQMTGLLLAPCGTMGGKMSATQAGRTMAATVEFSFSSGLTTSRRMSVAT